MTRGKITRLLRCPHPDCGTLVRESAQADHWIIAKHPHARIMQPAKRSAA